MQPVKSDESWFHQFESLIWAATLALASLAFVYTTFATTKYVDTKHEGVLEILHSIQEDVHEIRTFARENK